MVTSDDRQMIQAPTMSPACVQLFDIETDGTVTMSFSELCIPYRFIFNEPNENAVNLVLISAELSSLALRMFRMFSRHF